MASPRLLLAQDGGGRPYNCARVHHLCQEAPAPDRTGATNATISGNSTAKHGGDRHYKTFSKNLIGVPLHHFSLRSAS